jgi:hypothetical protein
MIVCHPGIGSPGVLAGVFPLAFNIRPTCWHFSSVTAYALQDVRHS